MNKVVMHLRGLGSIIMSCTPIAGITAVAAEGTGSTGAIEYGLVGLVLLAIVVPMIRSMQNRQDAMHKENSETIARREQREDERQEMREAREDERLKAYQQSVVSLSEITNELRHLSGRMNDHKAAAQLIRSDIAALPDRIVKKCNGAA